MHDIDTKAQENDILDRIEPIPRQDFPHHKYPRWIGHKFAPTGETLTYPGNTVLAHLPNHGLFRQKLEGLLASLKTHDLASAFTFLPPSSWHMTVYEGVTDQIRLRRSYPGDLSLESTLNVCHAHVADRLATFDHRLGSEGIGQMKVVGFEPVEDGVGLTLEPVDPQREMYLRDLRDRLSAQLKTNHPGHDSYCWHMAVGYTLRHLTSEEKLAMEEFLKSWLLSAGPLSFSLGVPEFCVYDDMCQFRRVFFLS